MNPRERILAMAVLFIVVLAGGAFLFHLFFLAPLSERAASIASLQLDIERRQERISQVEADMPRLERARFLSLPADVDLARRDYEKFLSQLIFESDFTPGSITVTAKPADSKNAPQIVGKGAVYTRLSFSVNGHGKLASLVKFLEKFYRTGLEHQIKSLAISRPLTANPQQGADELDINMTAEALILAGAEKRNQLMPGIDRRLAMVDVCLGLAQLPVGLGMLAQTAGPTGPNGPGVLAEPARNYDAIAKRDIFFGEPPQAPPGETVDVTRYWYLTDITQNERRWEAFFYDRYGPKRTRLRTESGFDSFQIRDEQGETKVRGRIVRIDPRDVIFKANENYYSMHVGQSLEESLRTPLSTSALKSLGLVAISTKDDASRR
jgi:hypothetical protein